MHFPRRLDDRLPPPVRLLPLSARFGPPPEQIDIYCDSDVEPEPVVRRTLESATRGQLHFRRPGTGHDRRRQPLGHGHRTLRAAAGHLQRRSRKARPAFAPDGESILFVSDSEGETDIWRATRADAHRYWWQNDSFVLQRLTQDAEQKTDIQWSPTGDKVAFVKGRGDLWVMDPDGRNARAC